SRRCCRRWRRRNRRPAFVRTGATTIAAGAGRSCAAPPRCPNAAPPSVRANTIARHPSRKHVAVRILPRADERRIAARDNASAPRLPPWKRREAGCPLSLRERRMDRVAAVRTLCEPDIDPCQEAWAAAFAGAFASALQGV